MRHSPSMPMVLALSAVFALALTLPSAAQQLPRPSQLPPPSGQAQPQRPGSPAGQAQQQQQPAPPKPYTPVAITPPKPFNDPSFAEFRKQLGDVAKRKDRAGLARLVVVQGFFWEGEKGDRADKRKSGVDNLAAALGLNAKDSNGWEMLAGVAEDPTLEEGERKGVMCGPASPTFDDTAFENLTKSTGTEDGDWGFPTSASLEVRGAPQPNAPVIEKLGPNLVRVMPDAGPGGPGGPGGARPNQPPPMLRIVTPSGKVGFVAMDAIIPMGSDQLCYIKDASGWKITGYIGGDQ